MISIRVLLAMACVALLLSFGAVESQAMFHKKKESKEKAVQACVEGSQKACDKAASKECSGKSGFKKDLCEKTSKQVCTEAAKKSCEKKVG